MKRVTLLVLLLLATTASLAYAQDAKRRYEILQLGLAYHNYNDQNNGPPSKIADLRTASATFPTLYKQVEDGEFIVVWNGILGDPNENEKVVLGYETAVPEQGGWVLRGGGSAIQMTAEEFRQMPKINTRP
jgi:outer membrane receptor for monomeric catechols